MSWKDRIENIQFKIVTGDGKEYTPLWRNGSKEKEFNTSKYDFIDQSGSLISRKKPQSNKFPLVFWFQGDDNIEQSNAFEKSANDSRLWTVTHPFYGVIKGQPLNLKRDDKDFNVTQVNVDFWESIDRDLPNSYISVLDAVDSKVSLVNDNAVSSFSQGAKVVVSDLPNLRATTIATTNKFTADSDSLSEYSNAVNEAVNSIDNVLEDSSSFIKLTQSIISLPASFSDTVSNKIKYYENAFNLLADSIFSKTDKFYFESQSSAIISGVAESIVSDEDSLVTRSDLELVNTKFIELFNRHLVVLDENQVSGDDVVNFWNPNPDLLRALFDLVFFTSNRLFELSFGAKQERTIELEKDSNLIVLTHRFLGLDDNDENLELFRQINNIRNNELFNVPKGRILTYYV